MPAVTEFIYFQTKSSVKPEDPSNDEGAALLQLFKATKSQSGHLSSAWGRTTEDENIIVWAIGWSLNLTPCLAWSTDTYILSSHRPTSSNLATMTRRPSKANIPSNRLVRLAQRNPTNQLPSRPFPRAEDSTHDLIHHPSAIRFGRSCNANPPLKPDNRAHAARVPDFALKTRPLGSQR